MKGLTELDKAYEKMGTENERQYISVIKDHYGMVNKTSFKYSRVDFVGENFCGELKSRNLSIRDFNETMIGYNKVKEGFKKIDNNTNYKVYFWFAFKEGLFAWELNRTNYETNGGDLQIRIGGTSNRGWEDYKDHYYLNTNNLIKISDIPVWIHPSVEENTKKRRIAIDKPVNYNPFNSSIPNGVCFLKIKSK
jgi:hypothetical protein